MRDASSRYEPGPAGGTAAHNGMTHERLRKFNTRDTYPEQRLDNDLCQVVKARGTLVFVRGQVGQDLAHQRRRSRSAIRPGQAEQAMAERRSSCSARPAPASTTSARSPST